MYVHWICDDQVLGLLLDCSAHLMNKLDASIICRVVDCSSGNGPMFECDGPGQKFTHHPHAELEQNHIPANDFRMQTRRRVRCGGMKICAPVLQDWAALSTPRKRALT